MQELKGQTCDCGHTSEFHKHQSIKCMLCHHKGGEGACQGFKPMTCPDCRGADVRTKYENDPFPYKIGDQTAILECVLPIRRCAVKDCDFQFLDWEAEEAHSRSVITYLIEREVKSQQDK